MRKRVLTQELKTIFCQVYKGRGEHKGPAERQTKGSAKRTKGGVRERVLPESQEKEGPSSGDMENENRLLRQGQKEG